MNSRLQKRLNEKQDRLFYTVYNQEKNEYYDLFEFKRFAELPIIEKTVFKIFLDCFNQTFETSDYRFPYYKTNLLVLYNIQFEELEDYKVISYKICNLLKEIYIQIRWKELYNLINTFKAKLTPEGVEKLKDYILAMPLSDFSTELKEKFYKFKEQISYKNDDAKLFKECLILSIYDEYQKGLLRTTKTQKKIKEAMDKDDVETAINILKNSVETN